jgi:hypothetical protein
LTRPELRDKELNPHAIYKGKESTTTERDPFALEELFPVGNLDTNVKEQKEKRFKKLWKKVGWKK